MEGAVVGGVCGGRDLGKEEREGGEMGAICRREGARPERRRAAGAWHVEVKV